MNLELSALDWFILVGYIAGICAAGVLVGLRVRTTDQYFLGGWLTMMGQSFGVGTHAEMPVALEETRHKTDHGFCDSMVFDGRRFIYADTVAGVLCRIDTHTDCVEKSRM